MRLGLQTYDPLSSIDMLKNKKNNVRRINMEDPFKNKEEIKLVEQVNELYGKPIINSLKPALNVFGEGLSGVLYFIFHKPIEYKVIHQAELADFTERMTQKIKQIPNEYRDSGKYSLVLEVLQNSVYQLNEEELRELFANLVASLTDRQKNKDITPRYVYILSQLGLKDALLLKELVTQDDNKLYYVREVNVINGKVGSSTQKVLYLHQTGKILEDVDSSMNVLESLGIIKFTNLIEEVLDDENSDVEMRKKLKLHLFNANELDANSNLELLNSNAIITSFGRAFLNCVVAPF